ncbi:uncharacterized protein LOC110683506 [Chenopodium quinoa]|uniref:uncharacterized protein LOC110683506 n=1 Tax=Chenopodium quinoa TaxID=63459 RepID=UPI000B7748B3|nr:uncharacterized protein LOC110683506 [Chenopodium quinoa]
MGVSLPFRILLRIYGGVSPISNPTGDKVWTPPPQVVAKINVDALDAEGWVVLGVVARDYKGKVLFVVVIRIKARCDPLVAESKASLFGIQKAIPFGYNDIILESDSLLLVFKLKKNSISFATVDGILEDILLAISNFSSIIGPMLSVMRILLSTMLLS